MKRLMNVGLIVAAVLPLCALAATPVSFREYIYSNAGGYGPIFNTGIYPDKTTRVVMTFKKDKTDGNQIFFGVRNGGFEFVNFIDDTDGTRMSFRFGNGTAHTIEPTGYELGTKATLDHGPNGCFLDGREIVSAANLAKSANNNTSSLPLALFTIQDGTKNINSWYDEWGRSWKGYCYDFRIEKGGACVARYYPCLDSDGTACFYDAVSKTLLYRATDYVKGHEYTKGALTLSDTMRSDIRFANGAVEFAVSAEANDARTGTVTASANWCAAGNSVTLTATPVSGSSFERWEGDLGAIVSGSATDSTIAVSPTTETISLKAVFTGNMVVEDRVLKINVPPSVTCTDDYTAYLSDVTNVVKLGAGTLVATPSSTYRGDWTIAEGVFEYKTADAFGQVVANDYTPVVRVLDGAQIYHNADNLALYRTIRLAGNGPSNTGALRFKTQSGNDYGTRNVKIFLDADTTVATGNRHAFNSETAVDCLGHKLFITGYQYNIPLYGSLTNSSKTPAVVSTASASYSKYAWNMKTTGGPQNVVSGDAGRFYANLAISAYDSDAWTFVFNGTTAFRSNVRGLNTFTRGWGGPVRVDKDAFFKNDDGSDAGNVGYASTLWGPLSGSADRTITVTRSIINICNANNTYAGAWVLTGCGTAEYRNTLVFAKGANWCGKSLAMTDSDLILDAAVDRALPAITVDTKNTFTGLTGAAKITGGTAGTTIESITVTGPNTFTLETPATIGELKVAAGTVVLATLPTVTKLVTVSGATLDLGGAVLTVDAFEGDPATLVNGKVVVRQSFTVVPGVFINPSVIDYSAVDQVCVKPSGTLAEGTYEAFYISGDVDLAEVWGQMAMGDYATFTKRTITEGAHAGQTLVEMVVTKTPPTATWSATQTGGAWNRAANWGGATPPTAATVTFPKAGAAAVPVDVNQNAILYSFMVQTGAGESDWLTPFGYAYAGTALWLLGTDEMTFSFAAGQNAIDVALVGTGTVKLDTALYPLTNVTGAVYSKTTVSEKSLERFTGKLAVNPSKRSFNGRTELGTAKFAGTMSVSGGEVKLDSLDFVKSREDLLIEGETTFAYTGADVTIPGLVWNVSRGDMNVAGGSILSVDDFYTKNTASALFKTGLGALKVGGTAALSFTGNNGGTDTDKGFSSIENSQGRPSWGRYRSINVCQGTLEIGEVGDASSAPSVTVGGDLALGNHEAPTKEAKLVVNNGEVNVSGTVWLPYYSRSEEVDAVRSIIINGGSFHAAKTDARIGYVVSDGKPYGRQVFEVNGGSFKIDGNFNLTQLCPFEGNSGKSQYQSTMTHTFTVNGGSAEVGCFRMGYSYGLTWDNKTSDNNGYGHGWQPDAYLTLNGGVMTINDYLLTTDRADSRSWTTLNGGVLKVNMISNTVGTAASTYLTFNGGALAPIGDGDNADELQLKANFTSAVVSTNGAIITTEYLPSDKTYVIRQAFLHDPACDAADGGLVKKGAGTLELAGVNTFTGPITVEGGTLVLGDKTLAPRANTLTLAAGTKLALKSGKVKVSGLTVNGVARPAGIYGSSTSGATNVDDTLFEGAGQLYVGQVGFFTIVR